MSRPRHSSPPVPACACSSAGVRCPIAQRLRHQFQAALELGDAGLQRALWATYLAHLHQAGVTPGRAQGEEGT